MSDQENSNHFMKIIGIIFLISLFSVVGLLFLALSSEEDGLIRNVMLEIPLLQDLIPQERSEKYDESINGDLEEGSFDESILDDSVIVNDDTNSVEEESNVEIEISDETDDVNIEYLSNSSEVRTAEILFRRLQLKEAQEIFVKYQDTDPVSNFYLGLIASFENDFQSSKAYFKRVQLLGGDVILQRNSKEIIKAFDEFYLYPGSTDDHLAVLLGRAYINIDQVSLGIVKLKQSLKINPYYKDAYVIIGAAYMMLEEYDQAINYLVQSLPTDRPEPNYYLGLARFNKSQYVEAITAFQEASDLGYHPELDLRVKLGESLMAVGKYEESLIEFDRSLDINPLDPELYYNPIWIYTNVLNDSEKALYYAELALSNNPQKSLPHVFLGWVYLSAAQYDEAKKYLDAAINLDPDSEAAYLYLGKYYESFADFDNAIAAFTQSYNLDSDSKYGKEAKKELNKY